MKTLLLKLNEIFDKSNNRLLRFSISFLVILTPFLCVSILVLIAVHNYLRAAVLILLLINSFFTNTRDNKLVLAFIGLIPIGFYVVTSPLFVGYVLGVQALNIGGILWDNKIMTVLSGVSIYGIIKAAKGASSVYEWFLNTSLGGYFFPEYKNLRDQLNVKNQAINKLITEKGELVKSVTKAKDQIKKLQLTATTIYDYFMNRQNNPNLPLPSRPQIDEDNTINAPNLVLLQDERTPEEIHQFLINQQEESNKVIKEGEEMVNKEKQTTQEIIDQPSTAVISVSDSTFTAVQKVLVGGTAVVGFEFLHQLQGADYYYLTQSYNVFKEYMRPSYAIIATTIGTGAAVIGVGETVNSAISITTNLVKGTQNLIEKGIKNLTEKMTSGEVPNTDQELAKKTKTAIRRERNKQVLNGIVDQVYGSLSTQKQLEHYTKQNTVEAPSIQPNSPKNVQDVSLVRKPRFIPPTTPQLPPAPIPTPPPLPKDLNSELLKSSADRPYTWIS